MDIIDFYHRTPIWLQNVMCSLEGARIQWQRYWGPFGRYVSEIRAFENLSPEEVATEQERMLTTMLEYAYRHVPFYRRTWAGIFSLKAKREPLKQLKDLPLIDRRTVKQNPLAFVSDEYNHRHLVPYPTGGTSGSPLVMRFTVDQIRRTFAFSEARIRNWAGVTFRSRHATFLGKKVVPPTQQSAPFWRSNRSGNQELFSIFHLNEATAPDYIRELRRFRPEIVVGYVTPIYVLSRYMLESGDYLDCNPKLVWTSSETLLNNQRQVIEQAFGCRVCNAYSGAEGVALITQCPSGGLHISPDFGVVELLPANGAGNLREIVGTTLFNFSMPLIRYRTGDLVELNEKKCSCGLAFPTVSSIIGRLDDTIRTPSGTLISSAPLSLVFQDAGGIEETQLVQVSETELLVKIVPSGTPQDIPISQIEGELRARLGLGMKVRTEIVSEIPRAENGKFRFIVGLRKG